MNIQESAFDKLSTKIDSLAHIYFTPKNIQDTKTHNKYNNKVVIKNPDIKYCKRCNTSKNISEFYKYKNSKDGLRHCCKLCMHLEKREYVREREQYDTLFKLISRTRLLISASLKNNGYKKNDKIEILLGCTFKQFQAHIENHFTEGMNWNNQGEWHLDHIIPVSSATNEIELIKLNHYSNLRPLWAKDNLEKSNNIPYSIIQKNSNSFKIEFSIKSDVEWFHHFKFKKLRENFKKNFLDASLSIENFSKKNKIKFFEKDTYK